MNIYGNTEDSNQHLVKKIFMHENLTDFNSIKGFLDHEEGILLYKMAKKYCIKTFAVEIGSYCGKSACYIGMGCKENRTHLVTIDVKKLHYNCNESQWSGRLSGQKEQKTARFSSK